mgnify:CR=1 FL=1
MLICSFVDRISAQDHDFQRLGMGPRVVKAGASLKPMNAVLRGLVVWSKRRATAVANMALVVSKVSNILFRVNLVSFRAQPPVAHRAMLSPLLHHNFKS